MATISLSIRAPRLSYSIWSRRLGKVELPPQDGDTWAFLSRRKVQAMGCRPVADTTPVSDEQDTSTGRGQLRVLHVLYGLPPYGQARCTVQLANGQRSLYGQVRLLAFEGGGLQEQVERSGLDYTILLDDKRSGFAGLVRAVLKELRARPPDVIHLSIARVPYVLATVVAARMAHIPVIGHIYTWPSRRGHTAVGPVMFRILRLLSGSLHWITLTEEAKRFYWDHCHIISSVVPGAVVLDRLDHVMASMPLSICDSPGIRVLCAASLGPVKNHDMLFRAMQRVISEEPEARLYLAGDGPREDTLRHLAARLGIDEHVAFLGYRDDVPALMRDSDLVCLTSRAEGFGGVLMEAGAARKPCIVTDIPGPREVVVDSVTGFVVPLDDDAALAERILQLSRDADLRRRMGEAARERVEELYTIERQVELVDEVYATALAHGSYTVGGST